MSNVGVRERESCCKLVKYDLISQLLVILWDIDLKFTFLFDRFHLESFVLESKMVDLFYLKSFLIFTLLILLSSIFSFS